MRKTKISQFIIGLILLCSIILETKQEEIKGVDFVKGINEKNKESNIGPYKTSTNSRCAVTASIKKQANNLTRGLTSVLAKAKAIFNFVRDNISYTYYNNSGKGADKTLATKSGNCCDQANLVVALCRASGIPVKYAHGQSTYFYYSKTTYSGHIWAQILVGDTWYAADPTGRQNSLGVIKNWNYHSFKNLKQYTLLPF